MISSRIVRLLLHFSIFWLQNDIQRAGFQYFLAQVTSTIDNMSFKSIDVDIEKHRFQDSLALASEVDKIYIQEAGFQILWVFVLQKSAK